MQTIPIIRADGHTLPAGTNVIVAIISIGRNPDVYDEPDEFRPERFFTNDGDDDDGIVKNQKTRSSFANVPFSAGPRNCVGQKFAELEMRSLLSKMLRCYELSLHPDSVPVPELDVAFIIAPTRRIQFHLRRREYL